MMRKSVVFAAVCLALSVSALAQGNQPQCSLSVLPNAGTAPLAVTATVNCTDSQSVITNVSLDWGDGSPVVNTIQTSFQAQHTYSTAGSFTVTVTATDALLNSGSATQNVSVAPNQPPTCSLTVSPTSGTAPLTVNATGTCTDPENDITSTVISWGDGTTTNGTNGSHTYNSNGTFTVTLTATDAANNTGASAPQTVTVSTNQPPTCTLSVTPAQGPVPLTVTATGNCTDPNNNIVTEVLNWGDGTTTAASSGTHTYTKAGTFTVRLTATDAGGLKDTVKQNVSVSGNAPPTCALAVVPTSGQAPLTVHATPSCTDPENDITAEVLNWGDGTTTAASNGTTYTHTYSGAGTFTITLTATDIAGNNGTAAQAVTVSGGPPDSTPSCTITATPTSGTAPLSVTVNANCTDPQNDITSITTSFGDGYYLLGANPSHTYVNSGNYTVTVVASDKAGATSKPVSQAITVTDNPVLFVGVSNGQVMQFTKSGTHQITLNSNQGGSMTGMSLDSALNLYTTDFTADTVSKFDGGGNLLGNFGSGYNCQPESIVFDASGNAYVGETGCSHALLKFDAYGNLEAAYSVTAEQEGSDWIDLAPDQCTIFYTSQGSSVLRYNACTRQQLPPFATGLSTGLGVKVLPSGDVLVAEKKDVVRFDSAGRKIMTYVASGESCFVSLALDSDNASFWAADYCSSDVVRFDINSGNEIFKFNSGTATNTVYGVAERVPPPKTSPAGALIPAPGQASIAGGQSATFTLNFSPDKSVAGQTFSFSCADLPAKATCSFSPSTVQAGSNLASTQLTIATSVASAQLLPQARTWMLALALPWIGMIMAFAGAEPDRRRKQLALLVISLVCLLALLSCSGASGNSSSPPPSSPTAPPTATTTTPSGTYTVVVHATTSAGAQSSTTLTLTVQ